MPRTVFPGHRCLEGHLINPLDEDVGHWRRSGGKLDIKAAIPRLGGDDADGGAAGAEARSAGRARHHGPILRHGLGMRAWHRRAIGKKQVQPRRYRHTDIGAGQRFEIGCQLQRRAGRMAGHIKRKNDAVLITEIVKAEGIEPLGERPSEVSCQAGCRALRQINGRGKPGLARGPPVDFPARGKGEFNAKRHLLKITSRRHRRDKARLADHRVPLPFRLRGLQAGRHQRQQRGKGEQPRGKAANSDGRGEFHLVLAAGPRGD